uniref:Redox-regulatory protein FAM213A n=1 Tax=Amphiprion percula TaxID=161767 RepID=A0A3P8RTL3_AMPPE
MALELIGNVAATIGGLVAGVMNVLTDLFLTKPLKATIQYLEEAELKTLQGDVKTFKAKTLWEKSGAVIMAVRRPG